MGRRVAEALVPPIGMAALALLWGCTEPDPGSGASASTGGAAGAVGAGGAPSTTGGSAPVVGAAGSASGGAAASVTWHQHVAPIVLAKCSGCHRVGGIAPMPLDTYAEAAPWAGTMAGAVESGRMPPWGARSTSECTPPHPWKDDLRPSAEQIALLRAWADLDAPEGDPATALALPAPPELELRDRNLRMTIPTSVEVSGSSDKFLCFSLDPGLTEDVWLNGVQVNPGNAEVVHHVLLFADPTGESATLAGQQGYYECFGGPLIDAPRLIGAWAPGAVPSVTPQNVGLALEAGARIVANVHYHPHGSGVQVDASTSVDLRWSTQTPLYVGQLALLGNLEPGDMQAAGGVGFGLLPGPDDPPEGPAFVIPAGSFAHTERMRIKVPESPIDFAFRMFAVGTHMHYVGRDMKIELEHADGSKECLIQTPEWDFDWQRGYQYDAPIEALPTVRPGDVFDMRCTYDNRMENPPVRDALFERNLSAPVEVRLGEQTLDEMCLGVFGIAIEASLAGLLP